MSPDSLNLDLHRLANRYSAEKAFRPAECHQMLLRDILPFVDLYRLIEDPYVRVRAVNQCSQTWKKDDDMMVASSVLQPSVFIWDF